MIDIAKAIMAFCEQRSMIVGSQGPIHLATFVDRKFYIHITVEALNWCESVEIATQWDSDTRIPSGSTLQPMDKK